MDWAFGSGGGAMAEGRTAVTEAASGRGWASAGRLGEIAGSAGRMEALEASGVVERLLEAAASSLAFAFGLVVSSAKSVGTSSNASAVVEINRAARFIVAPENLAARCTTGPSILAELPLNLFCAIFSAGACG